ncbi:MAG: hypothetical protein EP330_30365 [Deltaproteobacteria bacterium]|nr:MAG: hypothetical protein EP330_30365 [Deltaproteobacteria bacterium]
MRSILIALTLASAPASAAESLIEGGVEEAWEALRQLPPSWSWEFEMGVGYGDVPAWRLYSQSSLLMGGRFGFGKHLDNPNHRLGGSLTTSLDGPVPITFAWILEPAAGWDAVLGRVQLGVSGGYCLSYNARNDIYGWETTVTSGPSVALRIGYSDPWSRVARRFHIFVEPKLRYLQGLPSPGATLYVGSGYGR